MNPMLEAVIVMQEGPEGKSLAELECAISTIRQALPLVTLSGMIQATLEVRHSLGSFLGDYGKLTGDYRYFDEAVGEFSTGLGLMSPSTTSLDRAKFQVSVGQAYWQRGWLTNDRDTLKTSVDYLRAGKAAMERLGVREDLPTAIGSLANALTTLGEVDGSQRLFEEAIDLQQRAVDMLSRSDRPLEWALHKANLANSYRTYGHAFKLPHVFDLGLAACKASLEERRKSRDPRRWADSESIRGALLLDRGSLTRSRSDLQDAVKAFVAATDVHTRERNPRVWGDLHHNRGNALGYLGELTGKLKHFEAAIAAHQAALLERRRDNRPADWSLTVASLASELRKVGTLTGQASHLNKAADWERELRAVKVAQGVAKYRG